MSSATTPVPEDTTLDSAAFAAKVKAKHPEYKDVPDAELTARVLAKYPEYKSSVFQADSIKAPAPTPTTPEEQPDTSFLGNLGSVAKGAYNRVGKPLVEMANPMNWPSLLGMTASGQNGIFPIEDIRASLQRKVDAGEMNPHAAQALEMAARFANAAPPGLAASAVKGIVQGGKEDIGKVVQGMQTGMPQTASEGVGGLLGTAASLLAPGAEKPGAGIVGKLPTATGMVSKVLDLFNRKTPAASAASAAPVAEAATTAAEAVPKPPVPAMPLHGPAREIPLDQIPKNLHDQALKVSEQYAKSSDGTLPTVEDLHNQLPDPLKPYASTMRSQIIEDYSSYYNGQDWLKMANEMHGDKLKGLADGVHTLATSDPKSFDIVQTVNGKAVGVAAVRNGKLEAIAGGKFMDSPVSFRPVQEALDNAGVERSNSPGSLTSRGELSRRRGYEAASRQADATTGVNQAAAGGEASPGSQGAGQEAAQQPVPVGGAATGTRGGPGPTAQPQPTQAVAGDLPKPNLLPSQQPGANRIWGIIESYLGKTPSSSTVMSDAARAQQVGPQGILTGTVKSLLDKISNRTMGDSELSNTVGTHIDLSRQAASDAIDGLYSKITEKSKGLMVDLTPYLPKAKNLLYDLVKGKVLSGFEDPAAKTLRTFVDPENPTRQSFSTLAAAKSDIGSLLRRTGDQAIGTKGVGALKQLSNLIDDAMESAAAKSKEPGLFKMVKDARQQYQDYVQNYNESVVGEIAKQSKAGLGGEVGARTVAQVLDRTGPDGIARVRNTLPQPVWNAVQRNWLEGKIRSAVTGEAGGPNWLDTKAYEGAASHPELKGGRLQSVLNSIGEEKLRAMLDPQAVADLKTTADLAQRLAPKGGQGLMGSLIAARQYGKALHLIGAAGGAVSGALSGGGAVGAGEGAAVGVAGASAALMGEQVFARALARVITTPGGPATMRRFAEALSKTGKGAPAVATMYGKSLERMMGEDQQGDQGQTKTTTP